MRIGIVVISLLLAGLALSLDLHAQPGKAQKGEGLATVTRVRLGAAWRNTGGFPGYGPYDPFYWGGLFSPWSAPGSALASNPYPPIGTIRLKVTPPQARVTIDGGYAGTVEELRDLRLPPGAFPVQFNLAGFEEQQQRIYVLSGKTMQLDIKLRAQPAGAKP